MGHIELKRSGQNHTGLTYTINRGQNTLLIINEILAELRTVEVLATQPLATARCDLERMILQKYPLPLPENNIVQPTVFGCITNLLLHYVRPETMDQTGLLAEVEELQTTLLRLADEAAESIYAGVKPHLPIALIEEIQESVRTEGIPPEVSENITWEIIFGSVFEKIPALDQAVQSILPSRAIITKLFDFGPAARAEWQGIPF